MDVISQNKIRSLVKQYNEVLLQSMRIAVAEDLINLMILNRDDEELILKEVLLHEKKALYDLIIREFLRFNGSHIQQSDLQKMDSLPDLLAYFKSRREVLKELASSDEQKQCGDSD